LSTNTGPLATASWLAARGLLPDGPRWFVDVALSPVASRSPLVLDEETATQLQLEIYAEEWGIAFRHLGKGSWIRVTDLPFVHGRDDYVMLETIPALRNIGDLVRAIEARFAIRFERRAPTIRTSISSAEPIIRDWVATL
jgi:hypothetical protein